MLILILNIKITINLKDMKVHIIILNLIFFFTLNSISYAKKYEFDNIIIFGDSLSDQGFFKNKIAIADANNNNLYPEYLSLLFTGKHSIPNNDLNKNGNNYAIIGSTVVFKNEPNKKISYGINNFLKQTNNKVNPNNIYIIWAGGNDIAQDIEFFFKHVFNKNIKSTTNSYDSPINIKKNAIKLINNGAKYVIVPNIFNATLVPGIIINIRHLILASLNNNITKYLIFKSNINIDNDLRKSNNIPNITGEGTGKEFIRSKQAEILNDINIIGSLLNDKLKSSEIIINTFNSKLENELKSINKSIVFINIYELFNNIIDNPKFYGIDDIIMPICPFDIISQSSCSLGSKYYYNDKNYLWSDMIHPSPFMHMTYAQYITSIFNAPVLISSISKHLTAVNYNNQDYILNYLFNNKDNNIVNKIITFANINGLASKIGYPYDYNSKNTNTNSLNIGISYITPKTLLGLMLNLSLYNIKPYDNFKYRYNSEIINLFSKYYIRNKWLNIILNIGQINVTDMKRTIILGKGRHIENANTGGRSIGINFSIGYDFNYNKNNITLIPYINLDLHNYKINGFSEKDNKSTSMKYDKSSTTLKEIKLAFRFNKQNNNLKHFIELGIIKAIDNQPIKIKSSLKSTQTYFIREIFISKNPYLNLNIGFDKKFENNNISINTNLNFKINKDKDKQLIYSLGINKKF